MSEFKELLAFLYQQESKFVDEIDRINTCPQQVKLIPENALQLGGGWLFMAGELGSGDWNMARLIGHSEVAKRHMELLPDLEISLLVPEQDVTEFCGTQRRLGNLIYFADPELLPVNNDSDSDSDSDSYFGAEDLLPLSLQKKADYLLAEFAKKGLQVKTREFEVSAGGMDEADLTMYLLCNDRVQGYVKTVRITKNCLELYLEIMPGQRKRGFGSNLLALTLAKARLLRKKIIYVVDEDNTASCATAKKAGLQSFMCLARFILNPGK